MWNGSRRSGARLFIRLVLSGLLTVQTMAGVGEAVLWVVVVVLVFAGVPAARAANFYDKGIEGSNNNEASAVNFLRQYDRDASRMCNRFMKASWNYYTNITESNKRRMLAEQMKSLDFHRRKWSEASTFAWRGFNSSSVRRMFSFVTILGKAALPEDELREFTELLQEMKTTYSRAKICKYDPTRRRLPSGDYDYDADLDDEDENEIDCVPTLSLEPSLTRIMATSRDPDELRYVWRAWREAAGKPLRQPFLRFVELANEAAQLNGFEDAGEYWRSDYESETLREDLEELWQKLRPLYEQLHAYVRNKLREKYGEENVPSAGPIPAHLLGNMWAQTWTNTLDLTIPYPGRTSVDVTNSLRRRNYRPINMFSLAERFFTSLGLEPMTIDFWQNSLFEKPSDREVVCHASAWDFCDGQDYRIKQCTEVTTEDLAIIHHEMGHIQYDMQYRQQNFIFRDGANPGFHEAIGDVLALSASTPEHLKTVGLLANVDESFESDINFLFTMALDKIAFLPFSYLVDQWRWEVFSGETDESNLNDRWWDLRLSVQGVSPPVARDEEDFDPGAKHHIPNNIPYIRYFVSFILQFQFHSELCDTAGHQGPLHRCNIFGSFRAGRLLKNVLSLGKSRPWTEALSMLTSGKTDKLDADPILKYFAPLQAWLESQNRDQFVGWRESEAIVQRVTTSNASVITGVILAVLAVLLLLALIIIAIRKFKRTGKTFNTVAQGT